ncbi:MAG: HugZ family protein [Hydrogenophaga sp.]|uniref:HugZ family pyridoxamine 5'-phosphate oxidase n=1 Tax=Hydrogenophaga sp. TaxID=1904254 RepID=UPI003D9AC12F
MAHEPRLTRALRELLAAQRVAALGTVDEDGTPFVSMVPFVVDGQDRSLVIHISGLAAHTRNLQRRPRASLMICQAEVAGEPVHALPRVTLDIDAADAVAGADAQACRAAYLARFPEAEPMTALGDFRFVRLRPLGARQVAGFGAARSVDAAELLQALGSAT